MLVVFGGFGFVQKRDCPGDPPVGRWKERVVKVEVGGGEVEIPDIFWKLSRIQDKWLVH